MKKERITPAEHFIYTIVENVNNPNLSDAEFRAFARKTQPIMKNVGHKVPIDCHFCRKLGETTCGNDIENLSCFERR